MINKEDNKKILFKIQFKKSDVSKQFFSIPNNNIYDYF